VLENLLALAAKTFVLDGELVTPVKGGLPFDALQMRLHSAESRITRLSVETPATFIVFDCLLRKELLRLPVGSYSQNVSMIER
jgi:ATP-dependent DNA ligase